MIVKLKLMPQEMKTTVVTGIYQPKSQQLHRFSDGDQQERS